MNELSGPSPLSNFYAQSDSKTCNALRTAQSAWHEEPYTPDCVGCWHSASSATAPGGNWGTRFCPIPKHADSARRNKVPRGIRYMRFGTACRNMCMRMPFPKFIVVAPLPDLRGRGALCSAFQCDIEDNQLPHRNATPRPTSVDQKCPKRTKRFFRVDLISSAFTESSLPSIIHNADKVVLPTDEDGLHHGGMPMLSTDHFRMSNRAASLFR